MNTISRKEVSENIEETQQVLIYPGFSKDCELQ